jgi:hypothetical protein
MARRKVEPVHHSIKEKLGYPGDISDEEFWADWKVRTTKVCKPCWELKYCPYGTLVELSPLLPSTRDDAIANNEYLRKAIETETVGFKEDLNSQQKAELKELIDAMEDDPLAFALDVANDLRVEAIIQEVLDSGEDDPFSTLFEPPMSIHHYRSAFPIESQKERRKREEKAFTPEVRKRIEEKIKQMKKWLETGVRDHTKPIEGWRKRSFEKKVATFNADKYPSTTPTSIYETQCNIYGHVCPVFFAANAVTETTDERRLGRYIPFETKMRVVRRDNYTCQHCGKHLLDTEVEFDHIIPISKGGSSVESNVRLTCFDCNRSKSDDVEL